MEVLPSLFMAVAIFSTVIGQSYKSRSTEKHAEKVQELSSNGKAFIKRALVDNDSPHSNFGIGGTKVDNKQVDDRHKRSFGRNRHGEGWHGKMYQNFRVHDGGHRHAERWHGKMYQGFRLHGGIHNGPWGHHPSGHGPSGHTHFSISTILSTANQTTLNTPNPTQTSTMVHSAAESSTTIGTSAFVSNTSEEQTIKDTTNTSQIIHSKRAPVYFSTPSSIVTFTSVAEPSTSEHDGDKISCLLPSGSSEEICFDESMLWCETILCPR